MNALDKIVKFTSFFILPLGALLFLHARFVLDHSLEGAVVSTAAALIGMMPKGLVLLTSVSLAVGVIKLARKKTLVQELFCIENLSRVDMLCLDKTGTITQGKMTVSDILPLTAQPPFDLEEAVGSFIGALDDNNATFLALGERFPAQGRWRAVCRTPFSSARKWSSVTFEGRGTVLVGAPEILLRGRSGLLPPTVAEREAAGCRVVLVAHSEERVEGVLPGHGAAGGRSGAGGSHPARRPGDLGLFHPGGRTTENHFGGQPGDGVQHRPAGGAAPFRFVHRRLHPGR